MKNNLLNQRGQVILFVIVSMTIATAIGVTIATRTLSSLSRSSRSDTANKALAAAEAGAETYLAKDFDELAEDAGKDIPEIRFEDDVSGVTTTAKVSIESFTSNSESGSNYEFNLGTGHVKEVTFKDSGFSGSVDVCWSNENSALYYILYDESGITEKKLLTPSDNFNLDTEGGETASSSSEYDGGCKNDIGISSGTYGLRLRSLYEDTDVIVKSDNDLPTQGFKITSIGKLLEEGKVVTTKEVTVFKSKPYLPAIFDAAVYTEENFN